jgi:hypothetical protein
MTYPHAPVERRKKNMKDEKILCDCCGRNVAHPNAVPHNKATWKVSIKVKKTWFFGFDPRPAEEHDLCNECMNEIFEAVKEKVLTRPNR